MVGVRAPTMLPPLDSQEMAQGCNAALFTLPVALAQKQKRQAEKKYGAKVRNKLSGNTVMCVLLCMRVCGFQSHSGTQKYCDMQNVMTISRTQVAMHMEHAVVGSLGHAEILAEVIEEQGITLPQRPLSAVLPKMVSKDRSDIIADNWIN